MIFGIDNGILKLCLEANNDFTCKITENVDILNENFSCRGFKINFDEKLNPFLDTTGFADIFDTKNQLKFRNLIESLEIEIEFGGVYPKVVKGNFMPENADWNPDFSENSPFPMLNSGIYFNGISSIITFPKISNYPTNSSSHTALLISTTST